MWEDQLIVGITYDAEQHIEELTGSPDRQDWRDVPDGPFIIIHVRSEYGEPREWPHSVELMESYHSKEEPHWTNRFEILFGAALKLDEFEHYHDEISASYEPSEDVLIELRSRLRQHTSEYAKVVSDVRAALKDNDWNINGSHRKPLHKLVEKLSQQLVGKILRVDWDDERYYPGPAKHLMPFRPAIEPVFGNDVGIFGVDCRPKTEWINEWQSNQPVTFQKRLDETRERLEDDEEYRAEYEEEQEKGDWTLSYGGFGTKGACDVYRRTVNRKHEWAVRCDGKMHPITSKLIKIKCDCFVVESNGNFYRVSPNAANLLASEQGFHHESSEDNPKAFKINGIEFRVWNAEGQWEVKIHDNYFWIHKELYIVENQICVVTVKSETPVEVGAEGAMVLVQEYGFKIV